MKLLIPIILLSSCQEPVLSTFIETKEVKKEKTITVNMTSYYTPIITDVKDYGVNGVKVNYKGKELILYFPKGAVSVIEREGFGIVDVNTETLKGRYIIDNDFNVKPYVLGSQGNRLKKGEAATDNNYIPHGAIITIPALGIITKSKDVGGKIVGNDVDYYLGEGSWKKMERLSYKYNGKFKAIIN